jgi:hypothetical protein
LKVVFLLMLRRADKHAFNLVLVIKVMTSQPQNSGKTGETDEPWVHRCMWIEVER